MSQTEVQLIKDAVIVNADVSNSAAIDVSKISGAMPLAGGTFTGVTEFTANAKFDGATAGRDITFLRSTNTLRFQDNTILGLGDSDDFKMFHNGSITRFVHDLAGANLEFQPQIDEGDLFVFPSYVYHEHLASYSDKRRTVISFNILRDRTSKELGTQLYI